MFLASGGARLSGITWSTTRTQSSGRGRARLQCHVPGVGSQLGLRLNGCGVKHNRDVVAARDVNLAVEVWFLAGAFDECGLQPTSRAPQRRAAAEPSQTPAAWRPAGCSCDGGGGIAWPAWGTGPIGSRQAGAEADGMSTTAKRHDHHAIQERFRERDVGSAPDARMASLLVGRRRRWRRTARSGVPPNVLAERIGPQGPL